MQSNNLKMVRPQKLAKNVVVVDGISCSGKSLIIPVISSLDRAELWQQNHLYEYICIMEGLGRISRDAAIATVNLYADMDLYNSMIGRGTNMRPADLSSPYMNLLSDQYLRRLQEPDGDIVIKRINDANPILPIMTHYIMGISNLLFEAFTGRLKLFVLPVRHPLWLVELWNARNWHERMGIDPREFQFCCDVDGKIVPWFAHSWAQDYINMKPLEQSIHVVAYFWKTAISTYESLPQKHKNNILFVPFEQYCVSPSIFIKEIKNRLDTSETRVTHEVMTKLNLPRSFSTSDLVEERNKIDIMLRKEGLYATETNRLLRNLCEEYESVYMKGTP